jgi:hypothetical protein
LTETEIAEVTGLGGAAPTPEGTRLRDAAPTAEGTRLGDAAPTAEGTRLRGAAPTAEGTPRQSKSVAPIAIAPLPMLEGNITDS